MLFKHAFSLQCLFRNISIGCNRNFTSRDLLRASMKDAEILTQAPTIVSKLKAMQLGSFTHLSIEKPP